MKPSLLAFSLAASLLSLTASKPAEACSAPLTSVTLATTQAVDGATNVALDAPLLLQASAWPDSYRLENYNQLVLFSVEVKASGATALVPGTTSLFDQRLVWKPDAPLAPSTTYEVTIHVANDQPLPGDATGVVDQTLSFTTGTASLAPLTLTSAPSYAFETRSYPSCAPGKLDTCNHCSEPTTESHPSAIITLPTVSGGATEGGYFMIGRITDSAGKALVRDQRLPSSNETTLQLPIPDAVDPACLHVLVVDAAGNSVSSSSTCFTSEQIAQQLASSGAGGSGAGGTVGSGSGTTPTTSTGGTGSGELSDQKSSDPPAARSSDDDGGCSTSGRGGAGGALLVGLAALAARAGRRRSARAC